MLATRVFVANDDGGRGVRRQGAAPPGRRAAVAEPVGVAGGGAQPASVICSAVDFRNAGRVQQSGSVGEVPGARPEQQCRRRLSCCPGEVEALGWRRRPGPDCRSRPKRHSASRRSSEVSELARRSTLTTGSEGHCRIPTVSLGPNFAVRRQFLLTAGGGETWSARVCVAAGRHTARLRRGHCPGAVDLGIAGVLGHHG